MDTATEIRTSQFGTLKDKPVHAFTLVNKTGMEAEIISFGAVLKELRVPSSKGLLNVVLGFPALDQYVINKPHFGGTVGRYANRISNGRFKIDGTEYQLPLNHGKHTLHGGFTGFDRMLWEAKTEITEAGQSVVLTHSSADMEQGFPGNLVATVRYTLSDENALRIEYSAVTDKATPVSLTNHSYFNLKGAGEGDVLDHTLWLDADDITESDAELIPTGRLSSVHGTALDFREPHKLGERIAQLGAGKGYDHNYVMKTEPGEAKLVAKATAPSGLAMEVRTTEPCLQLYTSHNLDGTADSGSFPAFSGLCLEAQRHPDAPNRPEFPSQILKPGETYKQTTEYRFF